jgi:hypothetical protein
VTTASDTRVVEWDVVPDIQPGIALAMLATSPPPRGRDAPGRRSAHLGGLARRQRGAQLNTPLAYVAANLEYLVGAVPKLVPERAGAEIREALQESVEGVERLGLILQDLRTFVRRTSGEDDGPADLEAVLRSSVAMTWNEIRHRARLEKDVRRVPGPGQPGAAGAGVREPARERRPGDPRGDAISHVIRISAREQPGGFVAVEVTDTGAGSRPRSCPASSSRSSRPSRPARDRPRAQHLPQHRPGWAAGSR